MSVFHTVFQVHNFFDSAWRFPTLKQTSCKIRTALMRPFPADRRGKSPSPERQRLKWGMQPVSWLIRIPVVRLSYLDSPAHPPNWLFPALVGLLAAF
jgi:hypothetical protein